MEVLRVGVGIAFLCTVAGLALLWRGSKAFGVRAYRARPSGSSARGVAYAFGAGMLPGAKESVRTHMSAWAAGVGYHLGVFAALALLLPALLGLPLPRTMALALGLVALLGAACGLGLLLKRAFSPLLRSFSIPDDYLSNALATAFAALSGLGALGLLPEQVPCLRHS